MPLLVCSAQHCTYNTGMYCGKGDIMVEGSEASKACDTCCSSFRERRIDSASNSIGTPKHTVAVDCTADSCEYNEDRVCCADQIDISGASACRSCQTECRTFEKCRE
ncbi:MAG: DUF1540 domain-containing protein [Eubacteriales bacterium]|nr:DUF1540 domain-containing protein [Eubacteriales bacterium]